MSSYKCSKCNYTGSIKGNVKRHIAKMCDGAEMIENIVKLKCDVCNKQYETEIALINHKNVCVSKKALVVKEYIDAEDVMDKLQNLTILVNSLITSNEKTINENKELMKRLEKLEKLEVGIKLEKINKKKGFEELGEDDYETCCNESNDIRAVKSYEELYNKVDAKYREKCGTQIRACIIDGKGANITGIASESGFIRSDNGKKLEYGNENFVIKYRKCKNIASFKLLKTEECYCTKHFDTDTGKKLS